MIAPSGAESDGAALSRFVCDSITEYAIFTTTARGKIATWNPGAERAFGYTGAEVLGADFSIIFTAEDRAGGFPAAELRIARELGRLDRDCWHVRKNGSLFWATNTVQPLLDGDGGLLGFTKIVRDSTEPYEAAVALRESEERFRLLVDSIGHFAMFAVAPDGTVTLWNSGAEQIYGYGRKEIVGKPFAKLFTAGEVSCGLPELELRRANSLGQVENERWQVRSDGSRFFARRCVTRLRVAGLGAARGFSVTALDVTDARANERTMWDQAFHDGLTGLANRALLLEHLQRTIAHAKRRTRVGYAVLFLDLDQFKTINDRMGHLNADGVLAEVGRRLSASVRPEDVVARLGGDEFAVLLSGVRSAKSVLTLTDRIHRSMDAPIVVGGHKARVSTSIGAALGVAGYEQPDDLLRDADIAMYEAKSRGRSNTVVFEPRMRERIIRSGVG